MQLHKTDRARAELKPGVRTLGQRERTLLLMADGNRSVRDFLPLFDGDGERLHCACCARDSRKPIRVKNRKSQQAQFQRHHLPQSSVKTSQARTQAIKVSADQFEGKRSLATTRMFLFDLCERMFACRNPGMAERFREALRNAKDRETMLAASREMIEEIEKVAGHGRADSISERIAMLLPADSGANLAA